MLCPTQFPLGLARLLPPILPYHRCYRTGGRRQVRRVILLRGSAADLATGSSQSGPTYPSVKNWLWAPTRLPPSSESQLVFRAPATRSHRPVPGYWGNSAPCCGPLPVSPITWPASQPVWRHCKARPTQEVAPHPRFVLPAWCQCQRRHTKGALLHALRFRGRRYPTSHHLWSWGTHSQVWRRSGISQHRHPPGRPVSTRHALARALLRRSWFFFLAYVPLLSCSTPLPPPCTGPWSPTTESSRSSTIWTTSSQSGPLTLQFAMSMGRLPSRYSLTSVCFSIRLNARVPHPRWFFLASS